jgi:aminoglycoside 6-adenylyltransferase
MSESYDILTRIIEWAEREKYIRALILVGSRAGKESVDEFADFDIGVFAETHLPYTQDNEWLFDIRNVWVFVPEQFTRKNEVVPTRLVIFEDGIKVDFAFYGLHVLDELADDGDELNAGFKVLLDKDGKAERLKPASFAKSKRARPTQAEFIARVNEFWFETYYAAKYLKRDELWLAKFIDCNLKKFLLEIIEWHEQSKHDWDYETYYLGKAMKSWASADTWESLHQTFAHFGSDDSWTSLFATMNLFRRLALETAQMLDFSYPQEVDRNMTEFVLRIKADAA